MEAELGGRSQEDAPASSAARRRRTPLYICQELELDLSLHILAEASVSTSLDKFSLPKFRVGRRTGDRVEMRSARSRQLPCAGSPTKPRYRAGVSARRGFVCAGRRVAGGHSRAAHCCRRWHTRSRLLDSIGPRAWISRHLATISGTISSKLPPNRPTQIFGAVYVVQRAATPEVCAAR